MKTSKIVTSGAALTLAIFLGLAGVASAQHGDGHGPAGMGPGTGMGMGAGMGQGMGMGMGQGMGMTSEQATAMQQLHQEFAEKMQPTLQQHHLKMAELNNLAAAGVKPDDARVKAAQKDLRDIDAKLYSARADMLKQMSDKGIPFMAGHGMGHRMGMGRGMGHGMMGNGMMGNGGCPGMANMTNNTAQPAAAGNK